MPARSFKILFILLTTFIGATTRPVSAEETSHVLQALYIKDIDMDRGPLARGMDSLFQLFTPGGREARSILRDVRNIKMAVYETYDIRNERQALQDLMEDLQDDGWDTALKVRERDEQVWVMVRSGRDYIRDVYIISINPDELIRVEERRPDRRMIAEAIDHSKWENGRSEYKEEWDRSSRWLRRSWEHQTAALDDVWPDGYDDVHLRYNRVDGAYSGLRVGGNYRKTAVGITRFGELGYAFGSKRWQYQTGAEMYSFLSRMHMLSAGFSIHDRTATQDAWIVGEWENTTSSALLREDYRDYYRTKGMSAYGAYHIGRSIHISGRYMHEDLTSLPNTVNWSLFEHRYADAAFRPNPTIDAGELNSVQARIRIDTRRQRRGNRRGWLLSGTMENSGGILGGDYGFERYTVGLRRYQPLGRDMRLDLRARAGAADGTVPVQYLYDLGGISTMRGYGFKAFTGDRMVLLNAEYWIDDDMWVNQWPMDLFTVGGFVDAGTTWFSKAPAGLPPGIVPQLDPNFRYSAGFGVEAAGLRFYFARQLDSTDRDWKVSLRINRSF
ncbi:MAG: BamA/TamA family outer membrane protein [Candidatus Latescibacteria bacterium]|nr:BamA/TamA family outer membrane protein [Candidatus Latescibacterota bacterium]